MLTKFKIWYYSKLNDISGGVKFTAKYRFIIIFLLGAVFIVISTIFTEIFK